MLPFRSGRVRIATAWQAGRALLVLVLVCAFGSTAPGAGRGKKRLKKEAETAEQKGEDSIPLPVGHEAKGLVLPDYDRRGSLHNRFEVGVAKRLDVNHMQMRDLNLTTYTAQQKPDLRIRMSDSILDLNTKVISSKTRSTVRRKDFEIAGDTMQFDTAARQGTMSGNVKMVITGQAQLMPKGKQ
jgi:hypothetical protein